MAMAWDPQLQTLGCAAPFSALHLYKHADFFKNAAALLQNCSTMHFVCCCMLLK
jgi:hypothetical protein